MIHTFPYGDKFSSINIPDKNLISTYKTSGIETLEYEDIRDAVIESMECPIGSYRLEEIAKNKKNAVIISDDYTRQTPTRIIIPLLIEKLESIGISDITILIALGTHRPMTKEEMLKKFGKKICNKHKIINHNYKDTLHLKDFGYTENGTRLYLNELAYNADLLIGIGQIVPHRIAGYSGGAKIILPGIAGEESIAKTHWIGGITQTEEILGVIDNQVRQDMNQAAEKIGLDFIINVLCDSDGNFIEAFSGNFKEAHEMGCKLAEKAFGVYFHEKADIVIADSYPKDIELWQAAKALYAADLMVKDGGIIIFVTPCTEGIAHSHPSILKHGYKSEQETMAEIDSGTYKDMSVASHLLRVGRIIKDKTKCIMIKNNIDREQIKHLGFYYASTPQKAFDKAIKLKGENARVIILNKGGEVLPVYMRASKF